MPVNTKSARQQSLQLPFKLPRTLIGGTVSMIAARTTYTPQHNKEVDADYKVRLDSTTLYNAFKETVIKQTGKVFARDVVINEDVPEPIGILLKNIDGQGRNLSSFAYDAFYQAMIDGVSYVYVDFPPVITNENGFATQLDQQEQGARPSAILINAGNLLGLKHDNILGRQELTEVRVLESVSIPDAKDPYIEKEIEQVRVLTRGHYELWRKDESTTNGLNGLNASGDKWILHEAGETSIGYIPLVPIYTNRIGYMEGYPPLRQLAELNHEHWISSSEQRHALTLARFAMLVFTGVDADETIGQVSPNTIFKLNNDRADVKSISTAGSGIEQGFQDLTNIEERMRNTGMVIRVSGDSVQTATEASINSEESNAALLAAAASLENSINQVMDIFADYMGLPDGGTVTVSKAFGQKQVAGEFNELISMRVTGDLSQESLLEEGVRRGTLSDGFDIKRELQRTHDENMNDGGVLRAVNPQQPASQQMSDGNQSGLG
jgi:hypothetical protein